LKNSGKVVYQRDSADYYRVIMPPDTNIDKDLYRVYDYYFNGKTKSVATSLTRSANLILDGGCIEFFMNGKRKSTSQYKNGKIVGEVTLYYPNGQLYATLKAEDINNSYYSRYYNGLFVTPRYKMQVVEMRDSTGKVLAVNGTGHVVVFDDDFKKVIEEGDMNKGKKEGDWRGMIADSGRYICTFHKDVLKSGISYMKSGHRYTFKQIEVGPVYSDGTDAFNLFIKKNVQYPESAKKHKVMGTVLVRFFIETDGTISDATVVRGLIKSMDDEALRVIRLSPPWIPGSLYGIPMRSYYTVGVNFYNY
jgi:TonB family protein